MLTKNDLSQIRKVVREEVETDSENTKSELRAEMKLSRMETQSDLRTIKDRLKNVEVATAKIQKSVDIVVNFFDKQDIDTLKRVKKIEEQLGLSPLQ